MRKRLKPFSRELMASHDLKKPNPRHPVIGAKINPMKHDFDHRRSYDFLRYQKSRLF